MVHRILQEDTVHVSESSRCCIRNDVQQDSLLQGLSSGRVLRCVFYSKGRILDEKVILKGKDAILARMDEILKKGKDMSKKEEDEIPEFVKELLQKYPGYPALYIDSKGGVFTADAQPNWVKDAILYQNPYYKQ